MIAVGVDVGGTELVRSRIDCALMQAARSLIRLRPTFADGEVPSVNVVFHLPGSVHSPDWEGLRVERFTRKKKLMLISVAVPEEIVHSDQALEFVIQSLHTANGLAFQIFHRKGIEFPLQEAEALIDLVARKSAESAE